MSNDTETILQHYFMPGLSIDTNLDGSNPTFDDFDFFDSQGDTIIKYDGDFVDDSDPSRLAASEFLDTKTAAIREATKAILEGKTIIVLDGTPVETDIADDGGTGYPGVIVWFGEGEYDAAAKFRGDLDRGIYS